MRTRRNARAPKGAPTSTNLDTMWRYLHEGNGKISLRIDAGSATHLRRCLDAGLLELSPDKKYIRATEEGQRVMEAYQASLPPHLQTKPMPARQNGSRGRRNPRLKWVTCDEASEFACAGEPQRDLEPYLVAELANGERYDILRALDGSGFVLGHAFPSDLDEEYRVWNDRGGWLEEVQSWDRSGKVERAFAMSTKYKDAASAKRAAARASSEGPVAQKFRHIASASSYYASAKRNPLGHDAEILHKQIDGPDLLITLGAHTDLTAHNILRHAQDWQLTDYAAKVLGAKVEDVELVDVVSEKDAKRSYPGYSIVWEVVWYDGAKQARGNGRRARRNPLSASELVDLSELVEEDYRLPSDVAEQIVRYFDGEPKDEAAVRRAYHDLYVAPMRPFRPLGTDYWFIDGSLQGEHRVLYKDEDRGAYVLVRRLPRDEYGNERGSLIKAFPTPAQSVDFLNKEARKNRGTTPPRHRSLRRLRNPRSR